MWNCLSRLLHETDCRLREWVFSGLQRPLALARGKGLCEFFKQLLPPAYLNTGEESVGPINLTHLTNTFIQPICTGHWDKENRYDPALHGDYNLRRESGNNEEKKVHCDSCYEIIMNILENTNLKKISILLALCIEG